MLYIYNSNKNINIMLTPAQITEIFCFVDDFCIQFDHFFENHPFSDECFNFKKVDYSKFCLHPSEVITLQICFHHSAFRSFKSFYFQVAIPYLSNLFPNLPSYNRFVELQSMAFFHNYFFTKFSCVGQCDGVSYIDSFKLAVCHNKRIYQKKVFKNWAQRGCTSTGYFYGFKGHILINSKCEIIDFQLTSGNVADNNEQVLQELCKNVFGKIYGDKGYIMNSEKMEILFKKGIQFVTKLRKNMKNKLMDLMDKILLKKRGIVETVIDQLKNICQIEHTRHRSPINFYNNFLSAIAAYYFKADKPKLRINKKTQSNYNPLQLTLDL